MDIQGVKQYHGIGYHRENNQVMIIVFREVDFLVFGKLTAISKGQHACEAYELIQDYE